MKILLLGVGMQGKAALHDLVHHDAVREIIAADLDIEALRSHIEDKQYGHKVRCEQVDAANPENLNRLIGSGADVIINLLPKQFINTIAEAAIVHGIHMVFTSYITPEVAAMANEAKAKNITILPEFGLDPGIDLVLLGHAVRSLDTVDDILCYGAGFPEPAAANNAIKYKVSWTFEGVMQSYRRAGLVIRNGKVVTISDSEMFAPENIHLIDIPGIGTLEAFPNGDALKYADLLGIERSKLQTIGRYAMRWPGHCAFWKAMIDLHLLDSEPVLIDGKAIDRKQYLAAAMAPHLQYGADERDVTVVRVEVKGQLNGEQKHLVYQMIDKRDLETGLMSMNRTVGFTVSIGALMIGTGQIAKRGLLSPINDIPFEPFAQELATRGIQITSWLTAD
ncbi:MAG: saccharopine dehydrogenase NADP-binding domain-containing protein [Chloroflexi bacterium]|nr:saccharopine dehydrogenase NADP-binding domain-containing protein [Chloroflexota bacterium]